jgi:large subunit ribosomal protein L23
MLVLRRPILTEKALSLRDKGVYVFEVDPKANKIQIRQAIEKRFSVKVDAVRTLRVKGKRKVQTTRKGIFNGRKALVKKAYISLVPGQSIDIFDNESE